jgi:catechol 2,3-dioxygenase-like lactoylglutathione lyase family enzyme
MIDHISLRVTDFQRAKAFYAKALAPLGYTVLMEFPEAPDVAGLGAGGKPDLWITQVPSTTTVHIAFLAKDRATVDAFHAAAIAAGGTDFGAPGPRPIYHPGYYGAFVLDPDGHNIEACVHKPE